MTRPGRPRPRTSTSTPPARDGPGAPLMQPFLRWPVSLGAPRSALAGHAPVPRDPQSRSTATLPSSYTEEVQWRGLRWLNDEVTDEGTALANARPGSPLSM